MFLVSIKVGGFNVFKKRVPTITNVPAQLKVSDLSHCAFPPIISSDIKYLISVSESHVVRIAVCFFNCVKCPHRQGFFE